MGGGSVLAAPLGLAVVVKELPPDCPPMDGGCPPEEEEDGGEGGCPSVGGGGGGCIPPGGSPPGDIGVNVVWPSVGIGAGG